MQRHGVPNDIIQNLNPISLIIFIPIFDKIVYPILRKMNIHFTPLKRIAAGFLTTGTGILGACVIQYYIYKLSPCGNHANDCDKDQPAPINVWVQTVPYVLGGISEILASITSLEYAFTKAPRNMRSLVQAVALFMNSISSAIGQAFVPLSEDPLLIWNYAAVSVLAWVGGIGFWLSNYKYDKEEDALNALPEGQNVAGRRDVEKN